MNTIRVFRHYVQIKQLLLGLFELCLITAAVYISAYLRFAGGDFVRTYTAHLFWRALLVGGVMVLCMLVMGLYHRHLRDKYLRLIVRITLSFVIAGVVLAVVFYVFPSLYLGRGVMGLATVLGLAVVMPTHWVATNRLDEWAGRRRILIYGAGSNAAGILARLRRKTDFSTFDLIGCMPASGEAVRVDDKRLVGTEKSLHQWVIENRVDEVVVAMDEKRNALPIDELLQCRLSGVTVTDMLSFYERHTGKIKTDLVSPGWFIFSDGFGQKRVTTRGKRLLDVLVAGILLVLTWPLLGLAALLIWVEDGLGAPILYRQERVGENGRRFIILKLRSMRLDAESGGKAVWATDKDTRVTRMGRFLRKSRLDELPQVINVLRGDMSFVGPRPERPEFTGQLSKELGYYELRHRVKPGITGWAQLCYPYGASKEDALEKLQFDLYYVKNHSLFLDVIIILGTIEVILFGKGAR